MLRRYPVTGSDDDILRWHSSAESLGSPFWRLGLWPSSLRSYAQVLSTPIDAIGHLSDQVREQDLVELCKHPYPHWQILEFLFGWWGWPRARQTDPIDDLSRWPIPKGLSHLTGQRNIDTANVFGLMSTIQGNPSIISSLAHENHRKAISALEIAILGAAHLVRETEPEVLLGTFPGGLSSTHSSPARLHELRLKGISKGACAWFVEQMPQIAFPQKLEEVIQETAEKSYNDSTI